MLERSAKEQPEAACIHAGECGGCTYQTLPYEEQLAMKASQVKKLIDDVIVPENTDYEFLGIKASPRQQEYRNKMEFSFGDAYKGGPLALGMHKRGSFYDIVDVPECRIVDDDFHTVLTVTLDYFKERNLPYYHKLRHTGYLRHLLVRKAVKTGRSGGSGNDDTDSRRGGRGASCRMEGCVGVLPPIRERSPVCFTPATTVWRTPSQTRVRMCFLGRTISMKSC